MKNFSAIATGDKERELLQNRIDFLCGSPGWFASYNSTQAHR